MTAMQVSRNGSLFVAAREALVLVAYPDPDWNSPSNGLGHNDHSLKEGDTITIQQAFAQLSTDLSARAADVNRWLKVSVTQAQFDALLSCYFEYGTKDGAFAAVIAAVNSDLPLPVSTSFLECCKDKNGVVEVGLLYRRVEELLLYHTGNYGDIGTVDLFRGLPASTKSEIYSIQPGDI